MSNESHIPLSFKSFFWDVDIEKIDLNEHRVYVIERLLNDGDHRTLRWIFSTYSLEEIRKAVCTSRGLSLKTARYCQQFFNLTEENMRCFGTLNNNAIHK